jgi:hypothetical protein
LFFVRLILAILAYLIQISFARFAFGNFKVFGFENLITKCFVILLIVAVVVGIFILLFIL